MNHWIARLSLLTCGLLLLAALAAVMIGTATDTTPDSIMARNFCTLPCAFGVTPGLTPRDELVQIYGALSLRNPTFSTAREYNYVLRVDAPPDRSLTVNAVAASQSVAGSTAARASEDVGINESVKSIVFFDAIEDGLVESLRLFVSREEPLIWRVGDLMRAHGIPDRVALAYDPIDPDPTDADPTAICDPDRAQVPPDPAIILIYDDAILARARVRDRLSPDLELDQIAVTTRFDTTFTAFMAGMFPCHVLTTWQGFAPYGFYLD